MTVVLCAGVCVQTETVLRQALAERIKPVLVINKVDRAVFEKQLGPEELFRSLRSVINSVNAVVSIYAEDDSPMGNLTVSLCVCLFVGVSVCGWVCVCVHACMRACVCVCVEEGRCRML